jgi:hypothetical protein
MIMRHVLKPADLYHSAVIVDDVHATVERLAATTGMRFAPGWTRRSPCASTVRSACST